MNIEDIVKETLIKFQQQDYKNGGVSVAPAMYDTISREVVSKISSNFLVIKSVCFCSECKITMAKHTLSGTCEECWERIEKRTVL